MINLIFWFAIIIMIFVIKDEWCSTRNYIVLAAELIIEIGLIYVTLTI